VSKFCDELPDASFVANRYAVPATRSTEHHFTHYKDLKKPGSTVVKGFGDIDEAKAIIHEAVERWNNR
jgi:inorganic pyrophosphatase